jgi:uncharacterized membrane protein YfhO
MRANYVFRGIAVGTGLHTIHFWYHPSLIYVGAVVSLLTLFALLCATVLWLRQSLAQKPKPLPVDPAPD